MLSADHTRSAATPYHELLRYRWLLMATLVFVIVLSVLADFTLGPSALSWSELWQALMNPAGEQSTTSVIVWQLRLPYSMMAVAIGLGLGLAGAEMQTILNNPWPAPLLWGFRRLLPLAHLWLLFSICHYPVCPTPGW